MSHAFTVAGAGALSVADVHERLGFQRFRFREGTELPTGGGWPRGIAHGYVNGASTRPIETTYDGESLEVRILTCTDATTVGLACQLVALAAKHGSGKVRSEDHGEALSVADFERQYDSGWAAEHARTGFDMMRRLLGQNPASKSSMSGTTAELELGPRAKASLPSAPAAFERELSYRFRLLNYPEEQPVFFSSVLVLSDRDERRTVRMSSYAAVPTMLSAGADLVAFGRDEQMQYVPFAKFVELCGEHGRWITETLYLAPELDRDQLDALRERARPHAVTDLFAHGRMGEQATRGHVEADLSVDIARTIARIPAMVFLLVASADGKIEKKEVKVFQARLDQLLKVPNPALAEIMTVSKRMFEPAVQEVLDGKLKPALVLAEGADALERAFPEEACVLLKQLYLNIGLEIANANASGFFRRKIRDSEASALALVATLLRVPMPDK